MRKAARLWSYQMEINFLRKQPEPPIIALVHVGLADQAHSWFSFTLLGHYQECLVKHGYEQDLVRLIQTSVLCPTQVKLS